MFLIPWGASLRSPIVSHRARWRLAWSDKHAVQPFEVRSGSRGSHRSDSTLTTRRQRIPRMCDWPSWWMRRLSFQTRLIRANIQLRCCIRYAKKEAKAKPTAGIFSSLQCAGGAGRDDKAESQMINSGDGALMKNYPTVPTG